MTADPKLSALKFKKYLDEFGKVTSEVLISAPDTREGNEDIYRVGEEEVQAFWKRTLEKYGNEEDYNKQVINAFKHGDDLEIIIVIDKLLTGFDAPRNTVLYIARSLKEHTLLQAIARVNRLFEGKDFGYIIDYYGVLRELGEAMDLYGSLPEFDQDDLDLSITDITSEIKTLFPRSTQSFGTSSKRLRIRKTRKRTSRRYPTKQCDSVFMTSCRRTTELWVWRCRRSSSISILQKTR